MEEKIEQRLRELVRRRYDRWIEEWNFWNKIYKREPTSPPVEEIEKLVIDAWRRGFLCPYCGRKMDVEWKGAETWEEGTSWVLEHKIPHSLEGDDRIENLTVSCHGCNIVKGTMKSDTYTEMFKILSFYPEVRQKWLNESFRGWMKLRFERRKLEREVEELIKKRDSLKKEIEELEKKKAAHI